MIRQYRRLTRHEGYWRVDGVGEISTGSSSGSRVAVYFSKVSGSDLGSDLYRTAEEAKLRVKFHTASLTDFVIGSIWKDGKRVVQTGPDLEQISVDASSQKSLKLRDGTTMFGGYVPSVVPPTCFQIHNNRMHLASSFMVVVRVPYSNNGYRWLIIPSTELFRFYTGVTRRLSSAALRGTIDKLVDWSKCRLEGGHPTICARQPLYNVEKVVLARAITSAQAHEQLFGPRKYFVQQAVNNRARPPEEQERPCIKALFPFDGASTLTVRGTPFYLGQRGNKVKAFFATEILRCTHRFEHLPPVVELSGLKHKHGLPSDPSGGPPLSNPISEDDFRTPLQVSEGSADKRIRRIAILTTQNRFADLDDMQFITHHLDETGTRSRFGEDAEVTKPTWDEGTYEKEAKGRAGVDNGSHHGTPARQLTHFILMLLHLRAASRPLGWKVSTRTLESQISHGEAVITSFPDVQGRSWHLTHGENGKRRSRQVVWVEIKLPAKNCYCYLAELELRPKETGHCTAFFYDKQFARFYDTAFDKLLTLTTINNRWPRTNTRWKAGDHKKSADALFATMVLEPVRHPPVRPEATADKDSNPGTSAGEIDVKRWANDFVEAVSGSLPSWVMIADSSG